MAWAKGRSAPKSVTTRCNGREQHRWLTCALCAKGRMRLVPFRYCGSITSMSPKVVCQQSFFTLAPYTRFLPHFLRGFVNLARSPGLQGDLAGAAHLFDNTHFRRIRLLQFPCFVLNCQQQGLHAAAQFRVGAQPSHQLLIAHQRISHPSFAR